MEKVKVLFAMGGNMHRAGAETMIMQYLRQMIDDTRFQFSILVHGYTKGDFDDELMEMGVPLYHVPVRSSNPISYNKHVRKVLLSDTFDIVHCNMDSSCGYFLKIAKKCGIKNLVAHSHLTHFQAKDVLRKIVAIRSKKAIHKIATMRLACSQKAGHFLYDDDDFTVINNAIDLHKYEETFAVREQVRKELNIDSSTFVIGHIGRFHYQKNHKYLLRVFEKLTQLRENAKLLLIGEGDLLQEIKDIAQNLNLNDKVLFLGNRDDVPSLLQAMDVFVMPSLFEGLPVSGIEAQAAGLPCLFSDTITPEICMSNNAVRLSLNDMDLWVQQLLQAKEKNCREAQQKLRECGFDITKEAEKLKNCYLSIVNNK